MANSRYGYVRSFELPDALLPSTFLVVRIDGRAFHKFSEAHAFIKPNDVRGLGLMNRAAQTVMDEIADVTLAFGESDEYSFLIHPRSMLYSRRSAKIVTAIVSLFTSSYVFHWRTFFPDSELRYPPSFDGRVVVYPSAKEVRDYFAWRQVDTHINNLYNTTFWALCQQGGLSTKDAHAELRGTVSSQKHNILHQRFGINYNAEPDMFKKGSILVRVQEEDDASNPPPSTSIDTPSAAYPAPEPSPSPAPDALAVSATTLSDPAVTPSPDPSAQLTPDNRRMRKKKEKKPAEQDGTRGKVVVLHVDLIRDAFWEERSWLLR